ncbi:MAG: hypothetical protein ACKVS5_13390 [Parvularculaceae bacterium]
MKRTRKNPARPDIKSAIEAKKTRRRARRKREPSRSKLGQLAGLDFSYATRFWRDKGPVTEALVHCADGSRRNSRRVIRLGARIYNPFADDEAARVRQRARRSRRRTALLAQEARRRGVFRLEAKDFRP